MKPREFWLGVGDELNVDEIFLTKERTYKDSIHVREVLPIDWDKVWEEHDIQHKEYDSDLDNTNNYPPYFLRENIEQLVERALKGELE